MFGCCNGINPYSPYTNRPVPYGPWTRNMFAVRREEDADAELREGIASGRLPDWPAWSELMAEVPL